MNKTIYRTECEKYNNGKCPYLEGALTQELSGGLITLNWCPKFKLNNKYPACVTVTVKEEIL